MGLGESVVDIGTEGVQRGTALLVEFLAGHLSTTEAAADEDLDTLGAHAHGAGNCHLDGAAVRYTAFHLTGDVVGYDVGVELGPLDLEDVDLHVLVGNLAELLLQFVDLLAALADDGAGTGCVDGHCDELESPLDDDLGEVDLGDTGIEILTYLGVFEQLGCIVIPAVPIGVPAADDSYSVAARMIPILLLIGLIFCPIYFSS